ncbi:hypothetical protein PYH37_003654 [Sinorhizobium numidicum]|uniref:Uncharacterized protein n=1 Tax=Sinorhizobium numidicum TaxID=680248 RepID=A0ABY8D6B9_9HYPH|nr:hypothetical protein [Sinorhizobium numidicum]WEX79282.1 hypothetical protein PYH37_003654 [Sinorhizobium numidicum]WEX85262.1 hypothetical protein PYH38_004367 [Sinorhizobium numidicum]
MLLELDTILPYFDIAHLHILQYARAEMRASELLGPRVFGEIMDNTIQKSCWGVTIRAVAGFAGVLVLAHLFGGF